MQKKMTTRDITFAAILTAISLLLTFNPIKITLGPFTMTPASHVPTMVALFINPIVTLLTVIGSTVGFMIVTNPIVAIRAASHIIFALVGYKMLRSRVNIFLTVIVTGVLHAVGEMIIVFLLTPLIMPVALTGTTAAAYAVTALTLTLVQHGVDCVIAVPVLTALKKARLIRLPLTFAKLRAHDAQVSLDRA